MGDELLDTVPSDGGADEPIAGRQREPACAAAGQMVDHFKVLRLLGRGGMGEVYLARDTKLGRKIALKVVRRELLESKGAAERFLFEARATAAFSHPHIVAIHAVGEIDA